MVMRIGFYAAALGAFQQEKRLGVISNNIANVGTPGYKRDSVHFKDFMYQSTYSRWDQGKIAQTDNPLDIALNGEGYLRVQSDQGVLYTRAGNLKLNQAGNLVTQEGWPVLGKSGPITIEQGRNFRIEPTGQVFDGDTEVDTLEVVSFSRETQLDKVKNGYIKPADQTVNPVPAETCVVQQGALEQANFDIVQEMAQMVETTRLFEAYQKTIRTHEEQDANITTKLGSV
jgi:flagellar basal-body rod protein FlgF